MLLKVLAIASYNIAPRPGHEASTKTNTSRTARCEESMAGRVTFPNQAFQGTFSPHHKAPFNVSRFQLIRHPMSFSLETVQTSTLSSSDIISDRIRCRQVFS